MRFAEFHLRVSRFGCSLFEWMNKTLCKTVAKMKSKWNGERERLWGKTVRDFFSIISFPFACLFSGIWRWRNTKYVPISSQKFHVQSFCIFFSSSVSLDLSSECLSVFTWICVRIWRLYIHWLFKITYLMLFLLPLWCYTHFFSLVLLFILTALRFVMCRQRVFSSLFARHHSQREQNKKWNEATLFFSSADT